MSRTLQVSIGQHSDKGRKSVNQDFHGAITPEGPQLASKGVAVLLADGVSSSEVSQIAAESAVKSFLTDYYCTSDAWSVKTSAQRVIAAANSWLYAQTRASQFRYERDKGYVCTLSALVLRAGAAYLFHIGDSRIYRVAGGKLEQLTEDHRVRLSSHESYLGRALGVGRQVEIDHAQLPIVKGETFVLATDGVYEFASPAFVTQAIARHASDLDEAARAIVAEALRNGSDDNLTVQIVRVDAAPDGKADDAARRAADLPIPPILEARAELDGYRIVRSLHASSRSHVYLATDIETGATVVLKAPSVDRRDDAAYLRRFLLEEWVARRIDSPHVLKAPAPDRARASLYTVTEYVEGQTLAQWMIDHPRPELEAVRTIVEQIGKGLRSFHRREMAHQDLRPQNVLIDATGTAKIIDFGSVHIAGLAETGAEDADMQMAGTAQYAPPESFLGELAGPRGDIFSLGVIAYQMLTGELPYGASVARAASRAAQRRLRYRPIARDDIPVWIDRAIEKAVAIDPAARYEEVSELLFALRNPTSVTARPRPWLERNPLIFWKLLSFALAAALIAALAWRR